MKIVTKNYSLQNGVRSYLVYLTDHNDNSLECYDIKGDKERISKQVVMDLFDGVQTDLEEKVKINSK